MKPLSEKSLSDAEVLRRLAEVIRQSRRVEADLVFLIGEVDARKLYAPEAVPSTFLYCTEILHLSEPESVLRIRVARAAREHPVLLTMLREGQLHLSGIALLAPLLTARNRTTLLKRATHRSKEEIKALVAELAPRPDAPSTMRPPRCASCLSRGGSGRRLGAVHCVQTQWTAVTYWGIKTSSRRPAPLRVPVRVPCRAHEASPSPTAPGLGRTRSPSRGPPRGPPRSPSRRLGQRRSSPSRRPATGSSSPQMRRCATSSSDS